MNGVGEKMIEASPERFEAEEMMSEMGVTRVEMEVMRNGEGERETTREGHARRKLDDLEVRVVQRPQNRQPRATSTSMQLAQV